MSGELKGDQKEVSAIKASAIDLISSTEGPFWTGWTKFVSHGALYREQAVYF